MRLRFGPELIGGEWDNVDGPNCHGMHDPRTGQEIGGFGPTTFFGQKTPSPLPGFQSIPSAAAAGLGKEVPYARPLPL